MIAGMADNDPRSAVFAEGLLSGKVALVTGGGTGLGRETAIELARCGARVTIAGRRAQTLAAAAGEILREIGADAGEDAETAKTAAGAGGGSADADETARGACDGDAEDPQTGSGEDGVGAAGLVDWVAADVREPADARRLVETVVERRGRLDILVNNAGGQYFTPAEGIAPKGWRAVWRLNVEGMLNMSKAAVELGLGAAAMPAGESEGAAERALDEAALYGAEAGGVIVNVTLSPHHGMPGMAHSGAARATVEALTREMAERWAEKGIAVTAIAAGHFDTEAMSKYPDTVRAGMARSVPMQRLGEPREHAWLVALLCSPLGRALNGSTITLDGARDNWLGPWPPPGLTGETGEVPTEERKGARAGGRAPA
jgi:citronellol/citronellal dehydrogenase